MMVQDGCGGAVLPPLQFVSAGNMLLYGMTCVFAQGGYAVCQPFDLETILCDLEAGPGAQCMVF